MSILLIHNTLTKLWSNFLINEREKMVSILKPAKKFCAQKSDINEIKRLTKAGICTIIAQTVLRCTCEDPILLDFWNIQYALITLIFLIITWSPVYCRCGVSLNLAVQRHAFFFSQHNTSFEEWYLEKLRWKTVLKCQRHYCWLNV